jgi:cobalt-zinc-cadmium efflux system outer membrane protein
MNKKTHGIVLLGIVAMFLVQSHCIAEETITLEKAISLAFENNPRIIESRKAIIASGGDLITAGSLPDPEVEFEIGGFKRDEDGRRKTNLDGFRIRQGFDPPGVRKLKKEIAAAWVSVQKESLRQAWGEVYSQVRQTYNKIALDKKEIELAKGNLEILRNFFSRVQQRLQSGQALKNELQRARIELLKAENTCLAAEKELKTDKARLNLLMGRSMEVAFDIEDEPKEYKLEISLQKLTEIAFINRPDIKQEKINLNSKTKNVTKEKLKRLPAPFIGFQRIREDFENDYGVVFGFSFPLWSSNSGEIQKASAEKEAQWARLEATRREIAFEVYEAYLEVELAQKQLDSLKKSLEEANELLHLADLSYSEGEMDFINYLDQVRTVAETRVKYYEGLFNLNSTITELEKTVYTSMRKEAYL